MLPISAGKEKGGKKESTWSPTTMSMMMVTFGASALSWGNVVVKELEVDGLSSTNIALYRCFIASLALFPISLFLSRINKYFSYTPDDHAVHVVSASLGELGKSSKSIWKKWLLTTAGCGAFYALDLYALYWSIEMIPSGLSGIFLCPFFSQLVSLNLTVFRALPLTWTFLLAIINHTQIFWVSLYSSYFLGEKLSGEFKLCIASASGGILLLAIPSIVSGNTGGETKQVSARDGGIGLLLALASGLSNGGYFICFRESSRIASALPYVCNKAFNVASVCLMAALTLLCVELSHGELPSSIVNNPRMTKIELATVQHDLYIMLLLLGVGVHVVGYLSISIGISNIPMSTSAMLVLLNPALAEVWGVLVLHEPMGVVGAIGALIAVVSIYYGGLHFAAAPPPPPTIHTN